MPVWLIQCWQVCGVTQFTVSPSTGAPQGFFRCSPSDSNGLQLLRPQTAVQAVAAQIFGSSEGAFAKPYKYKSTDLVRGMKQHPLFKPPICAKPSFDTWTPKTSCLVLSGAYLSQALAKFNGYRHSWEFTVSHWVVCVSIAPPGLGNPRRQSCQQPSVLL